MSNFIGRPPFSNSLWVGIETMQFHIAQTKIYLRTPSFPIQGVPMNNLAPMKNCPGGVQGNLNWMPGYGVSPFQLKVHGPEFSLPPYSIFKTKLICCKCILKTVFVLLFHIKICAVDIWMLKCEICPKIKVKKQNSTHRTNNITSKPSNREKVCLSFLAGTTNI